MIDVRRATAGDLPAVKDIYAHHVLHGFGTFEEQPPDLEEMTRRWRALDEAGHPWLVAEAADGIVGYAYAGPYRPRSAYRFTLEDTVYVRRDQHRRGVGRALLGALVPACESRGARQLVAVIGDTGNAGSVGLHAAMGFRHAGTLRAVGFKHGRWVDVVLMQRPLGPGDTAGP